MRISVWSHDRNPSIDPHNYRRSKAQAADLLARGQAHHVEGGIQLCAPDARIDRSHVNDDSLMMTHGEIGPLSAKEARLNAEFQQDSRSNPPSVYLAHRKVEFYPKINESCRGPLATMVIAGCRA